MVLEVTRPEGNIPGRLCTRVSGLDNETGLAEWNSPEILA